MTGRLSVRARLTLLYGGLVLASGIGLIAVVYVLMRYIPQYAIGPVQATLARPQGDVPPNVTVVRPAMVITTKGDVLDTLLRFSGIALVALTLLAFGLGWVVAGRVLAPVQRITDTARVVASRNLHERINLGGAKDEFTELADTFDGMLDRLHTSFQAQQRFAANASHELRTPLATTRTMLQVALANPEEHDVRVLGPKLLDTNQRSIRTVEVLLALARAEHAIEHPRRVDLTSLAADALDEVRGEADERGVSLEQDLRAAAVGGDADLLRQLLLNLLRNALRHNHTGGSATCRVSGGEITVSNTGEVVTQETVERFFEPFQRHHSRTRGTGHGLGLTLVGAITEAHRGRVSATPNPGGGITIVVRLLGAGDWTDEAHRMTEQRDRSPSPG